MSFKHISVSETREMQANDELVIADIRDANTFGAGHIPGSVHLSNENLGRFLNEKDYEQPIIVVCYHGISSQNAANYLVQQGFENVYSMDGGFEAWKVAQPDHISK